MSGALAKVPFEGLVSRKYSLANLLEKTERYLVRDSFEVSFVPEFDVVFHLCKIWQQSVELPYFWFLVGHPQPTVFLCLLFLQVLDLAAA